MAFFCQHIFWVVVVGTMLGPVLMMAPFVGRYRQASWPLKSLLLAFGFLAFANGLLSLTMYYHLDHPFLSRTTLAFLVRLNHKLDLVGLGMGVLLFCVPEFWKLMKTRRTRRDLTPDAAPEAPVIS